MIYIFLILFSSFDLFAREDYVINIKYRGGNNLIYDCVHKYFVCASDVASEQCEVDRKEAIDMGKDEYPCAVLKKYKEKKSCLTKQYDVARVNALKKYCKSDRLKH